LETWMDECENGAERDGLVGSSGRVERAGKGTRGKAEGRKGGSEGSKRERRARAERKRESLCGRMPGDCPRDRASTRADVTTKDAIDENLKCGKEGAGGTRVVVVGGGNRSGEREGGGTGKARWSLQR
jgi:hypothetical protein